MKTCSKCREALPVESYYPQKGVCKPCYNSVRRSRPRGDIQRKHVYGLTAAAYQEMLDAQGGRCAICAALPEASLVVDHDHACCAGYRSCGECVRGLVCRLCNWMLGHAKDDPARLRAAADYLEQRRG